MALVLAVEPDHRQATILKRIVRELVRAELVLVDDPPEARLLPLKFSEPSESSFERASAFARYLTSRARESESSGDATPRDSEVRLC